jgi:uncharacterized protein
MKPSRYNRIFQASDRTWLAFNAWSTALAELTPEDRPFIEALLADPALPCDTPQKRDLREALIQGHFLIDDGEDELASTKADMLRDRFRTDQLLLTIAPTLNCNFRCDYCYEDHFRVNMSRTVQDALVAWAAERAQTVERMHVIWYGGEPLLPGAFEIVESLSHRFKELCAARGVIYGAELVTNGYFLDRKKMETLSGLGVGMVQVTLDGPPAVHDKRRVLAGGQGTFWRILENMKQVVDLAEIQLRINVDRRNAMGAVEVAEILREHGMEETVRPYLAMVTASGAACGNIQELCYSTKDFADMEVEVYREAAKRGLPLGRYPQKMEGAFCTADRVNAFVVAPGGSLFKCWHEVTLDPDKAIGHLLDGQQPFQKAIEDRWLSWDVMEKPGCNSCEVLPLCHGGCPIEGMKDAEADHGACEQFKFHLEPVVELQYLYQAENSGDGPAQGAARGPCK